MEEGIDRNDLFPCFQGIVILFEQNALTIRAMAMESTIDRSLPDS